MMRRLLVVVLILAVLLPACSALPFGGPSGPEQVTPLAAGGETPETGPETTPEGGDASPGVQATWPPPPPPEQVYGPAFADYPAVSVNMPERFAPVGYPLPVNLENVQGIELVTLTEGQRSLLSQNGFVVVPPAPDQYRAFYAPFSAAPLVFATTDSAYHITHLVFQKVLRDLERDYLRPTLDNLTLTLLQATTNQFEAVRGSALEEPARRNLAFFHVAAQLLELPGVPPAAVQDLVQEELALIRGHSELAVSPIWDRPELAEADKLLEDYTRYLPQGHYSLSPELTRYYLAMTWYGRLTFRLFDPFETQRALLLVAALRSASAPTGETAAQLWQRVFDPTSFIAGRSDDFSYYEYNALMDHIFGSNPQLQAFADPVLLVQFQGTARDLPPPQVNSFWAYLGANRGEAEKGFRLMGQRFTMDQYVFSQLVWPRVGTESNPRRFPAGLDLLAAFGSDDALGVLEEQRETAYVNYPAQMEKVRSELTAMEPQEWTQTLSGAWLYALFPLAELKDGRFPAFMQTQAWAYKDLQAGLGSWTELRHDTTVLAKTFVGGGGGGGIEPPRGYVEPNPEAFARLRALAQMMQDGLERRFLLGESNRALIGRLVDLLQFLQGFAEKELAGEPVSTDDYWRLSEYTRELAELTWSAADCTVPDGEACLDIGDFRSWLVVSIAEGPGPDGQPRVLQAATGQPALMYVVLPDEPYRIASGAVYQYYEFDVPLDGRLTDEAWRVLVSNGNLPRPPAWTETFTSP